MPKMFCVKGFAVGKNVTASFGSAVAAIMASSIAVSIAAPNPAVSSAEQQTSATERLRKEDLINAIGSALIDSVAQHFPLWIKVPRSIRMLAASSRR
jgi:fucose permease